jgi:hypothetical protein
MIGLGMVPISPTPSLLIDVIYIIPPCSFTPKGINPGLNPAILPVAES